jgi:hypothetical protein
VINHDVVGFHVSVHYALAVAVIQRLQQLQDVVTNIVVLELRVEAPEIRVVDIFEYQRRRLALGAPVSKSHFRKKGAREMRSLPSRPSNVRLPDYP